MSICVLFYEFLCDGGALQTGIFLHNAQLPKKHFSAKRKNGGFSVILAQTGSVVIVGHFFDGPDSSTKFRWRRSKIKWTNYGKVTQAQNGQKQGWAPKNDP